MWNSDLVCISSNLQLSIFGFDVENLKIPTTDRIFQTWLEDWEKDLLEINDCGTEVWLLKKYKDLLFFAPDTEKT